MPAPRRMLVAVDNCAEPPAPAPEAAIDCVGLKLRWLVRVRGSVAGHHVLRAVDEGADAIFGRAPLPRWSATTLPGASALRWSTEVRPRVLRSTDAFADRLGVAESAAALVIVEQARGVSGVVIEHELVVLVAFAEQALAPRGRGRASDSDCVQITG